MKNKISLFIAASLALLTFTACNNDNTVNIIQEQASISSKKNDLPVENLVERSRMEKYMGAFTGKVAIADNVLIPERGTIEGRELTRKFLTNTLEKLGYKVETHNYRKNGSNILVKLMADTPTDEYIIVGAHLDSVKNSGADDNGSGSTAILEAATVLPKLNNRKVNIIFGWFDEEELGLIGSQALASDYKKQKMKINSVHTIDMMGWDGDGDKTVELARPDGILWDYYKMVNEKHKLNLPLLRTNTGSSDHVSFHNSGFNSVNLSEEWTNGDSTPHYHKRTDTYETINFDYLAAGTKLLVATVGDLAMKVPGPIVKSQFIPHSNFPGRERPFHTDHSFDK